MFCMSLKSARSAQTGSLGYFGHVQRIWKYTGRLLPRGAIVEKAVTTVVRIITLKLCGYKSDSGGRFGGKLRI